MWLFLGDVNKNNFYSNHFTFLHLPSIQQKSTIYFYYLFLNVTNIFLENDQWHGLKINFLFVSGNM